MGRFWDRAMTDEFVGIQQNLKINLVVYVGRFWYRAMTDRFAGMQQNLKINL